MGWLSAVMHRQTAKVGALAAISLLIAVVVANGTAIGETANCDNPNVLAIQTLPGSAFEIDTNANLKVDDHDCIDWLSGTSVSDPLRSGVAAKADTPSGANDEAFKEGAKEDTTDPVIETGGIPPNKSDLSWFGVLHRGSAGN